MRGSKRPRRISLSPEIPSFSWPKLPGLSPRFRNYRCPPPPTPPSLHYGFRICSKVFLGIAGRGIEIHVCVRSLETLPTLLPLWTQWVDIRGIFLNFRFSRTKILIRLRIHEIPKKNFVRNFLEQKRRKRKGNKGKKSRFERMKIYFSALLTNVRFFGICWWKWKFVANDIARATFTFSTILSISPALLIKSRLKYWHA